MTAKRREFDWNLPGTGLAFRRSSAIVLFMGRSPAGFKRSLKVQLLHRLRVALHVVFHKLDVVIEVERSELGKSGE